MSNEMPRPAIALAPAAAPAAPAAAPVAPVAPAGGRAPVNRTKQYILDRIGKQREAMDEATRLKQEAEEREKKSKQDATDFQGQVRTLETQLLQVKGSSDGAAKERDEARGRLQAVQNLLAVAQKDKEIAESESAELRAALEEIQKAIG